jgi:hypothetical protein
VVGWIREFICDDLRGNAGKAKAKYNISRLFQQYLSFSIKGLP